MLCHVGFVYGPDILCAERLRADMQVWNLWLGNQLFNRIEQGSDAGNL